MGRRLIDADKLIELIDDDIASLDNDIPQIAYDVCLCTLQMVKQYIKVLPAVEAVPLEDYRSMEQTVYKLTQALADAEPIVRCKDCKYFYSEACEIWEVDENDYCSRGERKEVEE